MSAPHRYASQRINLCKITKKTDISVIIQRKYKKNILQQQTKKPSAEREQNTLHKQIMRLQVSDTSPLPYYYNILFFTKSCIYLQKISLMKLR